MTDANLLPGNARPQDELHTPLHSQIDFASVRSLAHAFAPVDLADIQEVSLQDRRETKFVFSIPILCDLLSDLTGDYKMLVVAGERLNRYRTLYFDTPEFDFYHRHIARAPFRTKVRAREYVETSTTFLEVKQRTNRKRTVKHRMPTNGLLTSLQGEYAGFVANGITAASLKSEDDGFAGKLAPVLWNRYQRLTLVGNQRQERVTLDLGLCFAGAGMIGEYRQDSLANIVIAEVKQSRIDRSSPIIEFLRAARVRPSSFSKYCMGVSLMQPEFPRHTINKTHRIVAKWQ